MAASIDHVVLWVEDAHRALEFYERLVGLAPVRAEEFRAGRSPFPSVRVSESSILDLMPAPMAALIAKAFPQAKPTAAGKPMNHVCLAMDRAGFEALEARLNQAGMFVHRASESFGARGIARQSFYFQDPDGNVLEARTYE